jgi:hypothetical protein
MVAVESECNANGDTLDDLDIQHTQLLRGIRLKKQAKVMTSPCYYQFSLGKVELWSSTLGESSLVVEGDVSFSLIRPSP